ncbi:hypothetical protein [Pinirhizobacter soli]|uniref:hypothetical protein n=1 Tax=Pinirhizobacter soli TaxID=2786953 RepID=UPI00202A5B9D|nr:hypothetical protein [Pinirhizobacter soli]
MTGWNASGQDALFADTLALVESVKSSDLGEARSRCNSLTARAQAVGDPALERAAASMACALEDFIPGGNIDLSYELADLMYEISSLKLVNHAKHYFAPRIG